MRAPEFWRHGRGPWPRLLLPFARIYARQTAARLRRPGWAAPVPVICCGNVTAGGAGKTTVAMEIAAMLRARRVDAHLLAGGYGGREKGPLKVDLARHDSDAVGDEALLLARVAPTWIGRDRGASARLAVAEGAKALVLDDGLQSPTLVKTLSILVVDGTSGFGNGLVIPAGPLREPVATCLARVQAVLLVGDDETGIAGALPADMPVLRARLVPGEGAAKVAGKPVVAFAGIANPRKFFATLSAAGAIVVARETFADHYPFDDGDMQALAREAARLRAELACTPKDFVRLPPAWHEKVRVVGVKLEWADPSAVATLLAPLFPGAFPPPHVLPPITPNQAPTPTPVLEG